jgi:hypothetical protein
MPPVVAPPVVALAPSVPTVFVAPPAPPTPEEAPEPPSVLPASPVVLEPPTPSDVVIAPVVPVPLVAVVPPTVFEPLADAELVLGVPTVADPSVPVVPAGCEPSPADDDVPGSSGLEHASVPNAANATNPRAIR